MHLDWGSLLVVAVVSAAVAVTVVALVAFALVGFSARLREPVGGAHDGRPPALSPTAGTAVAVLCVLAAALITGYGLYLIVA